jgi:hypothetical protein
MVGIPKILNVARQLNQPHSGELGNAYQRIESEFLQLLATGAEQRQVRIPAEQRFG